MAHDETKTNANDAVEASSEHATQPWNGLTMSVAGSGMSLSMSQFLRESRKRNDAPPPQPAVAPSGLLANLLRRI
jgi:hypothetical protein